MSTLFVVDGNAYLYRAYFTARAIHTDFKNALATMFLALVCKDAKDVKADRLIIGFDGNKGFRYRLYPGYKRSRHENKWLDTEKLPEKGRENVKPVYEYLPDVIEAIRTLGFQVAQVENLEADDLCCSYATQYKDQFDRVVCGARDKDHFQYLEGDHVMLYDSANRVNGELHPVYITQADAEAKTGIPVGKMRLFQTLYGDSTDDIPRIFGKKKAKELVLSYDKIEDAVEDVEYNTDLMANWETLKVNAQLVTLVSDAELPIDPKDAKPPKIENLQNEWLPKAYFNYIEWLYPTSGSLF